MQRRATTLLLGAFLLSGCVGPNYKRPTIETPASWREEPAVSTESIANTPWWDLFADPVLRDLIKVALVENKDLKIAVERIAEARARVGYTRADLFPKLDLNASAGRVGLSREAFTGVPSGTNNESDVYALSGNVFWEIDLFGRIRRATESEQALFFATEEARRGVVISLVADVAAAYLTLRDLDSRLAIAQRTLQSRGEYVELARVRFKGGLTSEKDWHQAEAEYYRTATFVSQFERLVVEQENILSVLLGRNPGTIVRGLSIEDQPLVPAIPAGLPSELLERRPDIRQAEDVLHSATADVGVAKALLYPRIALTAGYGTESSSLDALFTGPSAAWTVAGNLLQPIFNAGKNLRRVDIAESQMRQSLYAYERTVLNGLREVEDAIIGYRKLGEEKVEQHARVEAERNVLRMAELRYRGGVSPYLEVLDAQRSLFSAELDEVQAITSQQISVVRLYKALGGGWPYAADMPAEPSDRVFLLWGTRAHAHDASSGVVSPAR